MIIQNLDYMIRSLAMHNNALLYINKTINMSAAYGLFAFIALLLFIGYCAFTKKKNIWLVCLYCSVFLVNVGYFTLSISKTLEEALLANRIAYLGSVFLPLLMLIVVMDVCQIKRNRLFVGLLICISIVVFFIAASPGYLDCYYKEVQLVFINGMVKLDKVYGPLHNIYYIYLFMYFGMMIGTVVCSYRKRRLISIQKPALLLVVVLLNIVIWLLEQMIYWDFEFLAVSYIISEIFLWIIYSLQQDTNLSYAAEQAMFIENAEPKELSHTEEKAENFSINSIEDVAVFLPEVEILTTREREVLMAVLDNKKRKEIADELCVSENTIKKHLTHIFEKLGVENRVELLTMLNKRLQ